MAAENSKGFQIATELTLRILRVRAWGSWDVDFVKKYWYAFTEKLEEIQAGGSEWSLLINFTALNPLSEDVQRIVHEQIALAEQHGMKKLVYLGKKSTVQLQPSRPDASYQYSTIEDEEQALQWLLNEPQASMPVLKSGAG
jgi:hypothetical protein